MKGTGFFKKILSPMVVGNCLGMVVFVAVSVWAALYFVDEYTLHGESVEMPDLKGMNAAEAISKLESMGLQGMVTDTGFVENVPGDVILDQSIMKSRKIKPGRYVHLVVNSAEERRVALPADIAGNCSMREAELKLRARGFSIAEPQYILGDKDWVYEIKVKGSVVAPGTMVSVKSPLTLVVGDGKVEEEYSGGDNFYDEAFTDSLFVDSVKKSADDALFE